MLSLINTERPKIPTLESSKEPLLSSPVGLTPYSSFFSYLHTWVIHKQIWTHTIIEQKNNSSEKEKNFVENIPLSSFFNTLKTEFLIILKPHLLFCLESLKLCYMDLQILHKVSISADNIYNCLLHNL